MEADELSRVLSAIDGLRVTATSDRVVVNVPAIDDSVHLLAGDIRRAKRIFAPTGDPAVELAVGGERDVWPLILIRDDVVYAPMSPEALLDTPLRYRVRNAPSLVAYSEMERDAEAIALAHELRDGVDLDGAAGSLLMLRCFIAGAARFGLRPARAVAWWRRAWRAVGDVPLPRFRPDTAWDQLAEDASRLALEPSTPDEAESRCVGPRHAVRR
jgi:hypothetical protein